MLRKGKGKWRAQHWQHRDGGWWTKDSAMQSYRNGTKGGREDEHGDRGEDTDEEEMEEAERREMAPLSPSKQTQQAFLQSPMLQGYGGGSTAGRRCAAECAQSRTL